MYNDAEIMPLPRDDATPPETNTYLGFINNLLDVTGVQN